MLNSDLVPIEEMGKRDAIHKRFAHLLARRWQARVRRRT